jgi:hypothetical protein
MLDQASSQFLSIKQGKLKLKSKNSPLPRQSLGNLHPVHESPQHYTVQGGGVKLKRRMSNLSEKKHLLTQSCETLKSELPVFPEPSKPPLRGQSRNLQLQ